MRLSAKQAIVVSMAANPEPDEPVRHIDGQGSAVSACPRRPRPTDLFEVK
jgi:hypothetical protein